MTTADKLNAVINSKEKIKNAIESKGVTVGSAPLSQYAEKIDEIIEAPKFGVSYKHNESDPNFLDATVFIEGDKVPDLFLTGVNGYIAGSYFTNKLSSINVSRPFTKVGTIAFANNSFITEIGNMGKLTEIGVGAFHGCENLSSVELDENLETIEDYAFLECKSLSLNKFPSNLKKIGVMSFYGTQLAIQSLPNNLQEIGDSGLQETNINVENFPSTLNKIGNSALAECLQLTTVNLPGVSVVDSYAFERDSNITSATLGSQGNPVTVMGRDVFGRCESLTKINIYVSNPSSPGLTGAPWGATNAKITYLQA